METTFLIYFFINLGVVCLFDLLLSLKHLLFCKTIEERIGTTCFPAKNYLFCEVGKLKVEEKEEKQQLLVKIKEGVVSLMLWNFFVLDFI